MSQTDVINSQDGLPPGANNDREETEGKMIQATPDGELFMKHPLQNTWTLWFFKNDKDKEWEENQKPVIDFNTVEDFWSLYNHIAKASEIKVGCDYSLFKKGIKPMWEDSRNKEGGRWLIGLERDQRATQLDNFWIEVILLLIGEGFGAESSRLINGAVVNIRGKGDKVAIWMSRATMGEAVLDVGHRIKQRLGIKEIPIHFENHQDTKNKLGSRGKSAFTI